MRIVRSSAACPCGAAKDGQNRSEQGRETRADQKNPGLSHAWAEMATTHRTAAAHAVANRIGQAGVSLGTQAAPPPGPRGNHWRAGGKPMRRHEGGALGRHWGAAGKPLGSHWAATAEPPGNHLGATGKPAGQRLGGSHWEATWKPLWGTGEPVGRHWGALGSRWGATARPLGSEGGATGDRLGSHWAATE